MLTVGLRSESAGIFSSFKRMSPNRDTIRISPYNRVGVLLSLVPRRILGANDNVVGLRKGQSRYSNVGGQRTWSPTLTRKRWIVTPYGRTCCVIRNRRSFIKRVHTSRERGPLAIRTGSNSDILSRRLWGKSTKAGAPQKIRGESFVPSKGYRPGPPKTI
jgi:hypothetical protein